MKDEPEMMWTEAVLVYSSWCPPFIWKNWLKR
jgi:hypothetical protein